MRRNTVAVPNMMDPREWLAQHLAATDPDLVRSMLQSFVEQLMSAEASAVWQRRLRGTDHGTSERAEWVSGAALGHAGGHD